MLTRNERASIGRDYGIVENVLVDLCDGALEATRRAGEASDKANQSGNADDIKRRCWNMSGLRNRTTKPRTKGLGTQRPCTVNLLETITQSPTNIERLVSHGRRGHAISRRLWGGRNHYRKSEKQSEQSNQSSTRFKCCNRDRGNASLLPQPGYHWSCLRRTRPAPPQLAGARHHQLLLRNGVIPSSVGG